MGAEVSVVIHRETKAVANQNNAFLRALWKTYPQRMQRAGAPRPVNDQPIRRKISSTWECRKAMAQEARVVPFIHCGPLGKSIITSVAKAFGSTPEELAGRSRYRYMVRARFVAYRLLRDQTYGSGANRWSLPQIGLMLGRDHSTVCYGLDQFEIWIKRDEEMRGIYESLSEQIGEAA